MIGGEPAGGGYQVRVCVTGASGKLGRATTEELSRHGFDVLATDISSGPARPGPDVPLVRADLTEYGQAVEVLHGVDAVVHLANIPAPGIHTPATTFTANTAMNSNVFLAAVQLGLARVVWASSETTLGLPFDEPPRYAPVDEAHFPYPTTTYALSKVVGETMAGHLPAGPASRSWGCASPTSSARTTTRGSPNTGPTRGYGGGTCGATSIPGTRRRRAGWR